MAEVIVFADVVEALVIHLRDELELRGWTVTVATEVPAVRPTRLVRVLRTGGVRHPHLGVPTEQVQVTVECWAQTQANAHDLAQISRALIHAVSGIVEGVRFYLVEEVAGPVYLPDPLSDQPRWTFTVQLTARGGVAEPGS